MSLTLSTPPPLTTRFVPPNSCFTNLNWYPYTPGQSPLPSIALPASANVIEYIGVPGPGAPSCLPTDWALSSYYSPGVCPEGYAIACTSFNSIGTLTETIATCCPSGYSCLKGSTYVWQDSLSCTSTFTQYNSVTVTPGGVTTLLTELPGGGVNAYSVQVRWQSTDTKILELLTAASSFSESATSMPSSGIIGTPSRGTTSTQPTDTSSTLSTTPTDLSTGTKIAIGVVVPVVVLALLFGLFIWLRRRRSKSPSVPASTGSDPSLYGPWMKPELDSATTRTRPDENLSTHPTNTVELDAANSRFELPSPID